MSLALLPVIFASIELVAVILLLSFVCENTLPICPVVTSPLRNIAVMAIADIIPIVFVAFIVVKSFVLTYNITLALETAGRFHFYYERSLRGYFVVVAQNLEVSVSWVGDKLML